MICIVVVTKICYICLKVSRPNSLEIYLSFKETKLGVQFRKGPPKQSNKQSNDIKHFETIESKQWFDVC